MNAVEKIILFMASLPLLLAASPASELLPKIHLAPAEEEVTVAETGRVVEMECRITPAPRGAAAKLAVPGVEYLWTPSVQSARATGGADIYAFHCTADGTAAVICERTGGAGSNGTRIISVDIASGKVVRAGKVFKFKLLRSLLISDRKLLVAATDPGNDGTQFFLAVIDIAGDRILKQSGYFTGYPADIAHAGNVFYVLDAGTQDIDAYSARNFSLVAKRKPGFSGASAIAISPDLKHLAVCGSENLEIYEAGVNNATFYRLGSFKSNGADFRKAFYAGETLILYAPEKEAYLFTGNTIVPLDIRCGRISAYCSLSNELFLENRMREFEVFSLPRRTPAKKYAPLKMRPAVRNDIEALFFLPGKKAVALMADHRSNLWKIDFTGRRGKKTPVLIVDDTGIRKKR